MALLPHKYLLPDLSSCPSLNQEKRSTLHHHSRKPTTWFHQNTGNLKLFSFRFSVYPLKKKKKKADTALFKRCKWDVSNDFKSFLMQTHAELGDLSSLTLFCKQFQWTDASGKNNSLKKFPKSLMYITENRHWSFSYKNLANNLLLLFFRSSSFHKCSVLQKAVVHMQIHPWVTSKYFWLSSHFVYLFLLMQPQRVTPGGTGALRIVETMQKINA